MNAEGVEHFLHYIRTVEYFVAAMFLFGLAAHMRRIQYLPLAIGIFFVLAGIGAFFFGLGDFAIRDTVVTYFITPAILIVVVVTARALWYVSHNP